MIPETIPEVFAFLLKQGPAVTPDGACRLRTPDGKKCAIGCLIPDEKYSPRMELNNDQAMEVAEDTSMFNHKFIIRMQQAHDEASEYVQFGSKSWEEALTDEWDFYKLPR